MTSLDNLILAGSLLLVFLSVTVLIYALFAKKYRLILAAVTVALCLVGARLLFPDHFPYCDVWILGKTRQEIISLYGEPTGYDSSYMISYDLGPDCGFLGIMTSHMDVHYYIYFDENGKACKLVSGCPLGG